MIKREGPMQIVCAVLSFLLFCGFAFPGIVSACTLDSNGQGVAINCTKKPFMESHTVYADGKSTIRFHGQCYYSQGENAWNKHYYINAYWTVPRRGNRSLFQARTRQVPSSRRARRIRGSIMSCARKSHFPGAPLVIIR